MRQSTIDGETLEKDKTRTIEHTTDQFSFLHTPSYGRRRSHNKTIAGVHHVLIECCTIPAEEDASKHPTTEKSDERKSKTDLFFSSFPQCQATISYELISSRCVRRTFFRTSRFKIVQFIRRLRSEHKCFGSLLSKIKSFANSLNLLRSEIFELRNDNKHRFSKYQFGKNHELCESKKA